MNPTLQRIRDVYWAQQGHPAPAPSQAVRGDLRGAGYDLLLGDAKVRLADLPSESVDCIVTSPPYYRERDYGAKDQLGWEPTEVAFAERLLGILSECGRVLRRHGLFFLNFDDHKAHCRLACLDARIALGLPRIGLEKMHEVTWVKSTMPNGTDRSLSHVSEKVFVIKRQNNRHYWDAYLARQEALSGGKRRLTDVWTIPPTKPPHAREAHWATMPLELVRRCLEIGASQRGSCPECGAPWEREIERDGETQHARLYRGPGPAARRRERTGKATDSNSAPGNFVGTEIKSRGWRPSCDHRLPARPSIILDPFAGSGTTGLVALEMGFKFIGIDVNRKYLKGAAKALEGRRRDS